MTDKIFSQSGVPIRRTVELLPSVFQTDANSKFLAGTLDPLVQPGTLDKTVGYIGRRYGKTFNSKDVYLDTDNTLRSRYQLEPGVVIKNDNTIESFYDYIDFKNQLRFFNNETTRDDLITEQDHYSWAPPIHWDKFVNFREYYWVPDGPPPVKILGQSQSVESTYRVRLGDQSTFIFYPDGYKNNPTLTLYRGQKYKFQVNVPSNGFIIRTAYDTGSLNYNPNFGYSKNQYAVFDGKLWRAKKDIPFSEGSTINEQSEDWEYVEPALNASSLDYNKGVTNNGIVQGVVTFDIPLDAPDVLFYQSLTDPNRFGRFIIADIESNSKINIEEEIIGKETYTSSNGIEFSNGMVVYFLGEVAPAKYSLDKWIVEGVGDRIKLVRFKDLTPPRLSEIVPEVLFDNTGFDTDPFDDASLYPGTKDYIVIDRSSQDLNPWSRYNRWFHKSVLVFSHKFNGTDFDAPDTARAKRPIIEFKSNLQLFNHGTQAKSTVDFIDTFTTDVFSTIEGSQGYFVDGEALFQGARVLFVADTDQLTNNRIYEVNFINHSTGSAYRADWEVSSSYRSGETVRFQGQSFTSKADSPSYSLNILSSSSLTNRFRIIKNLNLKPDMAIKFTGATFGNIVANQTYFVVSVNNDDPDATEFNVSLSKRGSIVTLTYGVTGNSLMTGATAAHPTDLLVWSSSPDRQQISLRKVSDSESLIGEGVLIGRGRQNQGQMFHFTGDSWVQSQTKTAINQTPLFDVFDDDLISLGDSERYPVTGFIGSSILSYKQGNSVIDTELGFSLSYLNIDNVGDITFDFNWDTDEFSYEINRNSITKKISTGYYKFNDTQELGNCWVKSDNNYYQPIVDSVILTEDNTVVQIDAIDWAKTSNDLIFKILLYVNGEKYNGNYTRNKNKFIFDTALPKGTVVTIKVFCGVEPLDGYYEIPIGLEKNPLNQELTTFTLGQAVDHISTAIDISESFKGSYPGESNLRDIDNYHSLSKRFTKHSGLSPVAMFLLCDKQVNLIKSLEYATKSYRDYKNQFLQLAETLDYNQDPIEFVDTIIIEMTKVKKENDAFVDSDMLGAGAYSSKNYIVEDTGITVFALTEKFDLVSSSRKAVYIYRNDEQLTNTIDYEFNSNFGFVELKIELFENDRIEIREYVSTAFSFMPATPSKLGLYKKYLPIKYIDDSFLTPTEVIQGHDGSLTVAYGDYRDDVLLELEKRIYNNIKKTYTSEIYDIDSVFGGRYGNAVFTKDELDSILGIQFRRWAQTSKTDYVENTYFDILNTFTFNYGDLIDFTGTTNLPGWWRGVYHWYYDTDRPHVRPWEMLGFSEQPVWWENQYGPAPYTSNNLILWEDLRDGIIRQGDRAGTYPRYQRPTIMSHLPVDGDGNLLDPYSADLVGVISLRSSPGFFKFGDLAPVESSWRKSSDYPFAIMIASAVMRPFEFITENFDKNKLKRNLLDQTVCVDTNLFSKISNISVPIVGGKITTGLINYIVDYIKHLGLSTTILTEKLEGIDVNLSTRLSGFVDKSQQRYILDSKNPKSKTSSIFVPQENYDIIFNVSVPINSVTYSGVIIEKTDFGFKVYGYDTLDPRFKYYQHFVAGSQSISVGGIEARYVLWDQNSVYSNGEIVKYREAYYRSIISHNSGSSFDLSLWKRLPKLPITDATEAQARVNFDKTTVLNLEYGRIFLDIQSLVDFLCGYSEYLIDQGFEFNEYDTQLRETRNWSTGIKEFLFWTRHNWALGSVITISPASNKLVLKTLVGVVENFFDSFYDYRILQGDGKIISGNSINVNREFQQVTISPVDVNDGIFLFKAYSVLKEHITIFSDRTVFNDVLYDKTTGYRQDRIKSRGFRTTDWDGDYTSPGFIYDNVNIQSWKPFFDYKLGDIVSYRSYNWTSLVTQQGSESFDYSKWSKLDTTPEKQLVSNFDFKASQFEDYYNSDADGAGSSQRELARHAIGYQTRDYLQEIAEDQVTQFKLFQGFIREKGTSNSIIKVFDKLSKTYNSSVVLNEEWAFQIGKFGGVEQLSQVEFEVNKIDFRNNPQPLFIVEQIPRNNFTDLNIRTDKSKFSYLPVPFTTNINPVEKYTGVTRSAGYVRDDQIEFVVKTRDDILDADINAIPENSHIWITFDKGSWSVLRFNLINSLVITELIQNELNNTFVTLEFNKPHNFKVDDIVGFRGITNLTGFFKINLVTTQTIRIELPPPAYTVVFEGSTVSYNVCVLSEARYDKFRNIDPKYAALLKNGSKLWVDDGFSDKDAWQVIEKQTQYTSKTLENISITDPLGIGTSVIYSNNHKLSIFGAPRSRVVITAAEVLGNLEVRQFITPIALYQNSLNNSFGSVLALSPDEKWLAVGAPTASGISSRFIKETPTLGDVYNAGDIVLYAGQLWEAVNSHVSDGSSIDFNSQDWKPCTLIAGSSGGIPGPTNQGAVFLFRWQSGQWESSTVILSPRINDNEQFGSSIALSLSNGKYYMAVSAVGAINDTGRVYLFVYENNTWKIIEDRNYRGKFNSLASYLANEVVWYENSLWKAVVDIPMNSTFNTVDWTLTASSGSFLPSRTSYNEDGSTLSIGLLDDSTLADTTADITQVSEIIKQGDKFGDDLKISGDGSIIVVSAPNSDGQYFPNYKGLWKSDQVYTADDVVRYIDPLTTASSYRKLDDPRSDDDVNTDSTKKYTIIGQDPAGYPWVQIGDSSNIPTGKVFVYKRDVNGNYDLIQTITAGSLDEINDTGTQDAIYSGDQFGSAIDIDASGLVLVVTSPAADINFKSQGSAYIFRRNSLDSKEFRLVQKIQSFEEYPNEFFGSSISVSQRGERLAVGAKNAKYTAIAYFDNANTTFDDSLTRFTENRGNPGQVYIYERKDDTYFLVEKLDDNSLQDFESFGSSLDVTANVVLVGSPSYRDIVIPENFVQGISYVISTVGNTDWYAIGLSQLKSPIQGEQFTATGPGTGSGTALSNLAVGRIRIFKKTDVDIWKVIEEESDLVDLETIRNIRLIDSAESKNLGVLDIVDNFKLKILNVAEQELTYKTLYDPAIYTNGTEDNEVDTDQAWFSDNVGKLWWDISAVKFQYYEQGDVSYRIGNWNNQAYGSEIAIYEWVESSVDPTGWNGLADTTEGLTLGISGIAYNTSAYSVKIFYNRLTGEEVGTKYYFWVKNKRVTPKVPGRRISADSVQLLISNPASSTIPFVSPIDADKFLFWNLENLFISDKAQINIEYNRDRVVLNSIHNEYQLLTEGVADSLPAEMLETKWIDSLVGYDNSGSKVPDESLPSKQRYGLSFRPRQSMFADRFEVLGSVIDNINSILLTKNFADTINYTNLNLVDQVPAEILNEYDTAIDQNIDLQNVGTTRVKRPILAANIVDGSVDTISIIDPGFGYKVVPYVKIEGDGIGATAEVSIDSQGRILSARVISKGRKYRTANIKIRNFSVLVRQDETVNNYWAIYAWDDQRKVFIKSKIQSYDTTRYWNYIDWYSDGYSSTSRIVVELDSLYQESLIKVQIGDLIRVKEYSNGGWALLLKVQEGTGNISIDYSLVGRQNGTIQIDKESFIPKKGIGLDSISTFDGNLYDIQPTLELRNILKAVKDDIFLEDLRAEWNKLFFTSVRYAFVQLPVVDWAFKTSFLNAIHKVGDLNQRPSYKNDNIESFQSYIEEVKPYRTTIREYTSNYNGLDNSNIVISDFDSPPVYSPEDGQILPVGSDYYKFDEYPWKSFADNQGYSVVEINLFSNGSDYTEPPTVLIEGNGTGAAAISYISNGKVTGISITNPGTGYTSAPKVTLVGGNGTSQNRAKASAVISNGLIRSMSLTVKFDRISKNGMLKNFQQAETFIAPGFTASFDLKYAPSRDKSKISITKNGQLVLSNEYFITLYKTNDDLFSALKGKLIFLTPPAVGNVIEVVYDKSDDYLDSVNRIQKYYAPTSRMIGKELPQLMTGIDFGGVQIQGTTFDVTGGWDALPWFTDNWDSVESAADFYYVADGSTISVTLPDVPISGRMISIYIKRAVTTRPQNIDTIGDDNNPQVVLNLGVLSNTPERIDHITYPVKGLMPTFIGDGSTNVVEFLDPVTDEPYITVNAGDTLIFRPFDSDGSVVINDTNIIDTRLSGGSLAAMEGAYVTATGKTAEEIAIDGGKFIEPDHVPATEENVPGQVLESLSIKVYHTKPQAAAPLKSRIYYGDDTTVRYDIGLTILESKSLIVYVNKERVSNYSIDFLENAIEFVTPPTIGQVIELVSIGIGGINLLDYQEFVADGETDLFLTKAIYSQTASIIATVNGDEVDSVFVDSAEFADVAGYTMIKIGSRPATNQLVKIVCLGSSGVDTDSSSQSIIRVNQQSFVYDGSTSKFELDSFVNLSRASALSSVLIQVDDRIISGPDTIVKIYNGSNNNIELGVDPLLPSGTITISNISVYINNELQPVIVAYTFNNASKILTVDPDFLEEGDRITIQVDINSDYTVIGNDLVLSETFASTLNEDAIVDVTWFSEYPSFDIISDQYTGGKVKYKLQRSVIDSNFIWVYKNGERLTREVDYTVNVSRYEVYLNVSTEVSDKIRIVEFGNSTWTLPHSYEIFKDMLNVYHFKRYSRNDVVLNKDLNYYDLQIHVNDASSLFDPIPSKNIPGIVIIDNERIEYLQKTGNILSQLRRGSYGTAIAELHKAGSYVSDSGPRETIPYTEEQERYDFVSDGSTLLVGPLDFVPSQGTRSGVWYRGSNETAIPASYGPCDQLEVFAAGVRLRKDPLSVYDESIGSISPSADITEEAEFSVDGETPYVRLSKPMPAGTRIIMIKRTGKTWYDRELGTASKGITLDKNTNSIATFILQKTTNFPE